MGVEANQNDLYNAVNRIEDCLLEIKERMDTIIWKRNNKSTWSSVLVSTATEHIYTWRIESVW